MPKVLSQAGISLADAYDVEGSIAGIETLESRDVSLVHEMGATIASERFSTTIRRATTGALAQTTTWDLEIADLPATPARVLGIQVFSSEAVARSSFCQVSARDPIALREFPMWMWDTAPDTSANVRMQDNGAAVGNVTMLLPVNPSAFALPSFFGGAGQPQTVSSLMFRGITATFGAGTVIHTMIAYIAFAEVGGISSLGLPIPSW